MVKVGIIGSGGMAEYQAKRFAENRACQLWASDPEGSCNAYPCAVIDERHASIGQKLLSSGKALIGNLVCAHWIRALDYLVTCTQRD